LLKHGEMKQYDFLKEEEGGYNVINTGAKY
jgi:hypothetical protein